MARPRPSKSEMMAIVMYSAKKYIRSHDKYQHHYYRDVLGYAGPEAKTFEPTMGDLMIIRQIAEQIVDSFPLELRDRNLADGVGEQLLYDFYYRDYHYAILQYRDGN